MSIITLTTDFGEGSPYVAAMKGVLLSIAPEAKIVDITHSVPAQDIQRGAAILDEVASLFPEGTIHVAVVDPGVGTNRAIVYAEIAGQRYIAPDNGLLGRVSKKSLPTRIIRLTEQKYWRKPVSNTFHGRDIMAPVAAQVSLGLDPALLGCPVKEIIVFDVPGVKISEMRIEGAVTEIDSFGNLVTNITAEMIDDRPTDRRVCIVCYIYETWGIYRTYGDQPWGNALRIDRFERPARTGRRRRQRRCAIGDSAGQPGNAGVGLIQRSGDRDQEPGKFCTREGIGRFGMILKRGVGGGFLEFWQPLRSFVTKTVCGNNMQKILHITIDFSDKMCRINCTWES